MGLRGVFWGIAGAMAGCGALSAPAIARIAPRIEDRLEVVGFYGQNFDFWNKVHDLSQSASTADLLGVLDASFDRPEEGIATFGLKYHGPIRNAGVKGLFAPYFAEAYLGAGADALAGGAARNRILPEVHAYGVFTGHFDFGLMERAPARGSGWEYRLGSSSGGGAQSMVQGSALSVLGDFQPSAATLFYTGLDADLGYRSRFSESMRMRYRITLQPTLFHADYSGSGAQYRIEASQWTFRWREENEWTLTLDTPFVPEFDVGLVSILGAQPTPFQFLPRTWDAVHALKPWPAAGQLVGLGARLHVYHPDGGIVGLQLDGGFYGGYLGASAAFHLYWFQVAAGTYGVEQSAGYRIDESRIGFVSVGGRIAL